MPKTSVSSSYSIKEVSKKLSIPLKKLKQWNKSGIFPAQSTAEGDLAYSKELIDHLAKASPSTSFSPPSVPDKKSENLAAVKKALKEKHRIIQLLLDSESRYRDLVETTHDLLWTTNAEGRFTYLNQAALDFFGLPNSALIGRCLFDFETPSSRIANRRFLSILKRNGEVKNYTTHIITLKGEKRWLGINARISQDDYGHVIGVRGTAHDITDQHLAMQKIEYLVMHDTLTDLPNRRSLEKKIESEIKLGATGALLILDIDHFKYLNDNFGHAAGDELITEIATTLRSALKGSDAKLYRIGGDEFAIHILHPSPIKTNKLAERVLDAVRDFQFLNKNGIRFTNLSVSIGIAFYPEHGKDVPSLLSNADIAMYQAKEHGRNRYALFGQDASNERSTQKRVEWSKKLREALDEDRLVLYSQPVVRLIDKKITHYEILLRIKEADGTIILPGDFIEHAESIGMVQEVDYRVVKKILQHLQNPLVRDRKICYFVNLSRASVSNREWIQRLMRAVNESHADPSQLVFEITETAAMSEVNTTLSFIHKLKEMGSRFALDDFGAGFSSFQYLKRFNVDYLKIDGSFIQNLHTNQDKQIFVKAVCDIAKGLDKQVIAEWVANPQVLTTLINMGAHYGQGYLFQHPLPLENHFVQLITTHYQTNPLRDILS